MFAKWDTDVRAEKCDPDEKQELRGNVRAMCSRVPLYGNARRYQQNS